MIFGVVHLATPAVVFGSDSLRAISRRGLLPRAHRPTAPLKIGPRGIPFAAPVSTRCGWLRILARQAEHASVTASLAIEPRAPARALRYKGSVNIRRGQMTIRVTVWGENVHETTNAVVAGVYPDRMHGTIAAALNREAGITASTATLQEPDHGLTPARLAETDVLIWWGHAAHGAVEDAVADRVCAAVWGGMGAIFLHSAHFAKPFKRLMGSPCNLTWREAGERERIWLTARNHPIAAGLPDHFELEHEEMYGEPFGVPEPMETVFISWFQGGEVFRSGLTWRRGAGNVFYFRPGHETYPTYHDANVQRVIANAVRWAHNPAPRVTDPGAAPNVPVSAAPEPITERGPRLHGSGDEGFR